MSLTFTGEAKRGCGHRKHLGLYLVSDPGTNIPCEVMPWAVMPCTCCGMSPANFSRAFQWIRPEYFEADCTTKKCPAYGSCIFTAPATVTCPTCEGEGKMYKTELDKVGAQLELEMESVKCKSCRGRGRLVNTAGLMWVGKEFYTEESFIGEAQTMGVSKRIPANQIPRGLKLGLTWIMLGIRQSVDCGCDDPDECDLCVRGKLPAVFYAFRPQRLEMIVTLADLEDTCPECDGTGEVYDEHVDENIICEHCEASGVVDSKLAKRIEKQGITPIVVDPSELEEVK